MFTEPQSHSNFTYNLFFIDCFMLITKKKYWEKIGFGLIILINRFSSVGTLKKYDRKD
jgi:hypothetical protein